jgi:hypothetical protein
MDADDPKLTPYPGTRRATLPEIVAGLARQIDEGFTPVVADVYTQSNANAIDPREMRRLAALCDARQLPVEAARIRRWLGESGVNQR